MARQGVTPSKQKGVSSGRLACPGKGQTQKKKVSGRGVPLEPAYSLYSTDSEDQVTTVHKDLDRCAALLSGMLQEDNTVNLTGSKLKPLGVQTKSFKSKPKNPSRKHNTDRKKHGKSANTSVHVNKKPAPVQKSILSIRPLMNLTPHSCGSNKQKVSLIRKAQGSCDQLARVTALTHSENEQKISHTLTRPLPEAEHYLPDQLPTSTVFNCRLTTSTPAPLSPQRPGTSHGGTGSSKCVLNTASSPVESNFYRVLCAATPSCTQENLNPDHAFSMPLPKTQEGSHLIPSSVHESLTPAGTSPVSSVHQLGSSVSLSSVGSLTCPSLTEPETLIAKISRARSDPNGLDLKICREQENVHKARQEKDETDATPVRDIQCQTSYEKLTGLGPKNVSQEKTSQRVMTLKYLLGELKTLVANQDSDAVRLISDVEQSISLLPVMVGSTNIQAEIALALQPLRSENAQLRRRLRILNQQLLERERAERRAKPENFDMEVTALQSLNVTLQSQLSESHRELEDLQQENVRLQKALDEKNKDLKHHKDLSELEKSRLRIDVNESLAKIQSCQNQIQQEERKRAALSLSLQQREAEVSTLHELIRNLQPSQSKHMIGYSPPKDLCQSHCLLTKSTLQLHESADRGSAPAVSDKLSHSVQTYLQTLEGMEGASPSGSGSVIQFQSETYEAGLSGQTDGGTPTLMPEQSKICSRKEKYALKPAFETEDVSRIEGQRRASFGPLRESPVLQFFSGATHAFTSTSLRKDVDFVSCGFKNLDISFGHHIQDCEETKNRHSDEMMVFQPLSQCLGMSVQSVNTGRPSVMESTLASCDFKSLASDWSMNSWSTFNTLDEQNFREGLAALDASIESLQKTLKIDLSK